MHATYIHIRIKTKNRKPYQRGGRYRHNINYGIPKDEPQHAPPPIRIRIQELDDEQLAQLIAAVNAELERR